MSEAIERISVTMVVDENLYEHFCVEEQFYVLSADIQVHDCAAPNILYLGMPRLPATLQSCTIPLKHSSFCQKLCKQLLVFLLYYRHITCVAPEARFTIHVIDTLD